MDVSIFDLMKKRTVLLDGAMGTELMKNGLIRGTCPELWNVEKPEIIEKIHKSYFDVGSDVVLTNSFGGNKIKLSSYELGQRCYELNYAAASIANEVKPPGKFIAGSMGPTGKFLEPYGQFTVKEFEESYEIQAKGLTDGKVDFLLIETQYHIEEALCALRGSRKSSDLPIFVTMTFNSTPRGFYTIMGNSVFRCLEILEFQGVPVLGTNCTLNSAEMVGLIKIMREKTSLPLIAKPNVGKPYLSEDGDVVYSQSLNNYILYIPGIIENGANLIGGCCGTNVEHIKRMAEIISKD